MSGKRASLDGPIRVSGEGHMLKAAAARPYPAASPFSGACPREESLARAIYAAGPPACENTGGWWAYSETRGVAVPRNCKRWQCPACRRFKRLSVLAALQDGLAQYHH